MKTKRLNELMRKLEMEVELQPLLDSNANSEWGYARLSRAVDNCLRLYDLSKDYICGAEAKKYNGVWGYRRSPRYIAKSSGKPTILGKIDESADLFRKYYGIGCESQELDEVAIEFLGGKKYRERVSHELKEARKYAQYAKLHMSEEEYNSRCKGIKYIKERSERTLEDAKKYCLGKIDQVTKMLKMNHKSDIWYGTLGGR